MSLTDIMSAARLSTYAEVALVLFLLAFCGVALRVFGKRDRQYWEHARRLPLEEDENAQREEGSAR